jgi:phosphoglycolate phosphatase-like HAD superfamily hydrolase
VAVRAVVFDLDECLIDSRAAWAYTVEQSLAAVTGRHLRAGEDLVAEYRRRPWRDVFAILCGDAAGSDRCCEVADAMFRRSALKRLLVHEGIGMALDGLRASRIQIGAISRFPHAEAIKHIESTGLDRFVLVLCPTPRGEVWSPSFRVNEALGYLGCVPREAAYVSADGETAGSEVRTLQARWGTGLDNGLTHPSQLGSALDRTT